MKPGSVKTVNKGKLQFQQMVRCGSLCVLRLPLGEHQQLLERVQGHRREAVGLVSASTFFLADSIARFQTSDLYESKNLVSVRLPSAELNTAVA
jgi:hypothetical protein